MREEQRERLSYELAVELAEAPRYKRPAAPGAREDLEREEQQQPLDGEAAARAWRSERGLGGPARGRGR